MKPTKDDPCVRELRDFLSERFLPTRTNLVKELKLQRRNSLCSAVTLLIYRHIYCSDSPRAEFRKILRKYFRRR